MISDLLTPGRLTRAVSGGSAAMEGAVAGAGSLAATRILDYRDRSVQQFLQSLPMPADDHDFFAAAYARIRRTIRPVYSLADTRPVSRVLRLQRGSCSQRFAVLEAAARWRGIATRVRALLVAGEFWHQRFRLRGPFVPELILLAWPEFLIGASWATAAGVLAADHSQDVRPFDNTGADTLFDAIGRGAADWSGQDVSGCACDSKAFADFVKADRGLFASRDELFATFGLNLPTPVRLLVEPIGSRWSAVSTRRGTNKPLPLPVTPR